jgi:hypothetical protein
MEIVMSQPLTAEMVTYDRIRGSLTADEGRYAVIAGDSLIGVFDTYNDALTAGYAQRGLEPFLVKQISSVNVVANFTRSLTQACPTLA